MSIGPLGINEIKFYQKNRYPLLFVDKVTIVEPGEFAEGLKVFTYNEWFFPSHFEEDPNVPGFIQIEALVQVFIMTFLTLPNLEGMQTSFVSIENARFRKRIIPGDSLQIRATLNSFSKGIAKGSSVGYINDLEAVSAQFVIAVPNILDTYKRK